MKNQSPAPAISPKSYLLGVLFLLVLVFLAHQGYKTQHPAVSLEMGMTPGAVAAFQQEPTVIPLSRGEVPVGVLKLNGTTYVIYSTPTQ